MSPVPPPPVIYVVDDDHDVLTSLRFLLEAEGFAVETFGSAEALLSSGKAAGAGCLVIDYRMAPMTGLDLLHRLRAQAVEVPVVLITGHPDPAIPERAALAGVRHFILKPHVDENLIVEIRRAIAARSTP